MCSYFRVLEVESWVWRHKSRPLAERPFCLSGLVVRELPWEVRETLDLDWRVLKVFLLGLEEGEVVPEKVVRGVRSFLLEVELPGGDCFSRELRRYFSRLAESVGMSSTVLWQTRERRFGPLSRMPKPSPRKSRNKRR